MASHKLRNSNTKKPHSYYLRGLIFHILNLATIDTFLLEVCIYDDSQTQTLSKVAKEKYII